MRHALAALLVVVCANAQAGHGFMNAFADVEWLPEPGTLPGDWRYPLERLAERAELALAAPGEARFALALAFAKEKLAEASAELAAGDAEAARAALAHWGAYVDAAAETVEAESDEAAGDRRQRLLDALLEHAYIMSIDYVDQPLGTRAVMLPMLDGAVERYERHAAALPRTAKEAMFFKEEEIRWSVEMARQADAQGITNAPAEGAISSPGP